MQEPETAAQYMYGKKAQTTDHEEKNNNFISQTGQHLGPTDIE